MKTKTLLVLCILSGLASLGAAPPDPQRLRLLHADEQSVVLELEFSAVDLQAEDVTHNGVTYHRLTLPGLNQTTEAGHPQVPLKGVLLGTPGGGPTVEILAAEAETLTGYRPYPAPEIVAREADGTRYAVPKFTLDDAAYATDAFYPGPLAEVGFFGRLRDQAVAQLRLYPVQVNPVTGEVQFYRHLRVRISFEGATPAGQPRRAGGAAYEALLQNTLLDYAGLERGPLPDAAPADPQAIVTAEPPPALKIAVIEDGIYRLTPTDLENAGLSLSDLDPRTIRMTHRGHEIPIHVTGEDDGRFDASDTILFYGTAMTGTVTVENVYWLTYGGENGQRMAARDVPPGGATVPTEFYNLLRAEEDHIYWLNLPNGEDQDHYFWDKLVAPESGSYEIALHNLAGVAASAHLTVTLRGKTDTSADPDHHTRVTLNGALVSDEWWDGQIEYQHRSTFSQSQLQEGVNTLRVESMGDTGASVDELYLNRFEIGYRDTYIAENDLLAFRGPSDGTFQFEVAGFASADVQVFDVTQPADVARLIDVEVVAQESAYLARFQDSCAADTRYLALTPARYKSPASIVLDEPSMLRSTANGADYVIITHPDFSAAALTLANFRASQGLRVETVGVTDVYDEFNHGIFDPGAIRDFLTYAYENWTVPAPEYVLLLGDANMDYRDILGTGNPNYVPTHLIQTEDFGDTPSDNWFVCVSGDDLLPDMFLGRISARSAADAQAVVDKIIAYEQNPPAGAWNQTALFVADDDESSFEAISEELIGYLHGGFTPQRVYVGDYTSPDSPTADIIGHISDGVALVNYAGHGNVDNWGVWSGGRTFQTSDVDALNNSGRLPFVTTANCLNGFFAHPYDSHAHSLGEAFLHGGHQGALAAWAPSGLGYPSGHRVLIGELYRAIFDSADPIIGSATTMAKLATYAQSSGWGDLVETFVLFGDPASRLNLPPAPEDAPHQVYLPALLRNGP